MPEPERVKHACERLTKRQLLKGNYPETDQKMSLDEFMGLDDRGSNAMLPLKNAVVLKNTDASGNPTGHGPLGKKFPRHRTVDLKL